MWFALLRQCGSVLLLILQRVQEDGTSLVSTNHRFVFTVHRTNTILYITPSYGRTLIISTWTYVRHLDDSFSANSWQRNWWTQNFTKTPSCPPRVVDSRAALLLTHIVFNSLRLHIAVRNRGSPTGTRIELCQIMARLPRVEWDHMTTKPNPMTWLTVSTENYIIYLTNFGVYWTTKGIWETTPRIPSTTVGRWPPAPSDLRRTQHQKARFWLHHWCWADVIGAPCCGKWPQYFLLSHQVLPQIISLPLFWFEQKPCFVLTTNQPRYTQRRASLVAEKIRGVIRFRTTLEHESNTCRLAVDLGLIYTIWRHKFLGRDIDFLSEVSLRCIRAL